MLTTRTYELEKVCSETFTNVIQVGKKIKFVSAVNTTKERFKISLLFIIISRPCGIKRTVFHVSALS